MRQAYLIMAHNNIEILKKCIELIDDYDNEIFIHIDKKSYNISKNSLDKVCRLSKIHFIERLDIRWGDFSQVQCEINLLKEAYKGNFDYYHLISGVDLPIKTQDEIKNFLDKNLGKEFVHFCDKEETEMYKIRSNRYYYTKLLRGKYSNLNKALNKILIIIQNIIKYEKNKGLNIKKGSNWFSITHKLVNVILENEEWINKCFKNTLCPDEHFLQTLIYKEKLEENLYKFYLEGDISNSLREIDWKKGDPYIYTENDFNLLINSNNIFARKFDKVKDFNIVNLIYDYLKNFD